MTFNVGNAGASADFVIVGVFVAIIIILTAVVFGLLPMKLAAMRYPEAVARYRERRRAATPESRLARFDWDRYEIGDAYVSWFEDPDDYGDGIAAGVMGLVIVGLSWWMVTVINGFVASGFGFG